MADFAWDPREASPAALKEIQKHFEYAYLDINYFNALASAISKLGFERDELTRPISHFFDGAYGYTFNLSGIAGVMTAGALGFHAGTAHAPVNANKRAKYIFFGSTHTAVDEDGKQGNVLREGQHGKVGHACGAIEEIKGEIASEEVQTGAIRDTDVEYDTFKKKIFSHTPPPSATASNFDITKITIDVITTDFETYIKTLDTSNADYVVFTGVQIHAGVTGNTPGKHLDYIAHYEAYAVINGVKKHFKLDGKKFSLEN